MRNRVKKFLFQRGYSLNRLQVTGKPPARGDTGDSPSRLPNYEYNERPNVRRMLFVVGLHRSGTTLVEQHVVNNLEIACLRMGVPENEGQHAQNVFSPDDALGGPGRFAFNRELEEELKGIPDAPSAREKLLSAWSRFVVGDSDTLAEKSPSNLLRVAWLRSVFPGAKFLVVTRDPRAVAGATQKWSKTSLYELMMHWNVAYSKASRDFLPADCLSVRYEDFVEEPLGELERIESFIEVPRKEESKNVIDDRFSGLENRNAAYVARHTVPSYGKGIWDEYGYVV